MTRKVDWATAAALVIIGVAWFLDHQHQEAETAVVLDKLDIVATEHGQLLGWVDEHRAEMGARLDAAQECLDVQAQQAVNKPAD